MCSIYLPERERESSFHFISPTTKKIPLPTFEKVNGFMICMMIARNNLILESNQKMLVMVSTPLIELFACLVGWFVGDGHLVLGYFFLMKYKLFLYLVPLITKATLAIYHYDVIMIITTTTAIIGRLVVMKRISTEFFFTNKKSMNAKFRNETKNENQSQGKKANINTKWKWIPNSRTITMLYSPPLLPSSSWSWQ